MSQRTTSKLLRFSGYSASLFAWIALIVVLNNFLEKNRVSLPDTYEDADLTLQAKKLKGYMLGTEGLVADWFWIQSLQYVGNKIAKDKSASISLDDLRYLNLQLLYPYLDAATDLDPKFMPAYSYGATVLPGIDPELAIKLSEKGIANNPDSWRLHQYLGYIYWRLEDYDKAAETYENGSRIAGAPPFMRQMMAAMKTQGGDRKTARLIYSQMAAEAEDEQTKNNAQLRLAELETLDEIDVLNKNLDLFKQRGGRCPENWNELVGFLRVLKSPETANLRFDQTNTPVAPTDKPYELDGEACKASVKK